MSYLHKWLVALTLCQPALTLAQEESATWWELGLGVALVSFPHYPGADQSSSLITPFPYPVFHSEHLSLDEEGLIASVAEQGRFSLKASLNGALPVDDSESRARAGMAYLDLVIEAGPSLHISLWESDLAEWRLELPLRAALKVNADELISLSGWTSNPGVYYETRLGEWHWESSLGAVWSSRDYHGFFYDVDLTEALAERPAYRAEAGFTASRASMTLKRRWGDFLAICYLRYMNFSGAANSDSSLLRSRDYLAGGLSFIYLFYTSK